MDKANQQRNRGGEGRQKGECVMKPTCRRCRLFIVDREGAVCEVCRKKIGIERNAVAVCAAWERKRAAKETCK